MLSVNYESSKNQAQKGRYFLFLSDVESGDILTNPNYSQEVILMLRDGTISFGKKNTDCFKKDRLIYIKNEMLGKKLSKKYGRSFSAKKIAAYFKERYISVVYHDGRPKKCDNKCYLVLKPKELYADSKEETHRINNLFYNG